MKRLIALFLLLILLMPGCANRIKEPVTFYYIRSVYDQDMDSIIHSETREASGHRQDLSYLMALYFMGPADEELQSPIPRGISLLSIEQTGQNVILKLSDTSHVMSDAQFTLACSCLTLTCLEITETESVTIVSGERSITMSADALLLQDLNTTAETEESQ